MYLNLSHTRHIISVVFFIKRIINKISFVVSPLHKYLISIHLCERVYGQIIKLNSLDFIFKSQNIKLTKMAKKEIDKIMYNY